MLLIAAFLCATGLVIAGYFVLFAAGKSEDRLKAAGKYIAAWCFIFAAVVVIAGIVGSFMRQERAFYGRPGMMMHPGMMGGGMMGPGMHRPRFFFRERAPEPKTETPTTPAPATPAPTAPKS